MTGRGVVQIGRSIRPSVCLFVCACVCRVQVCVTPYPFDVETHGDGAGVPYDKSPHGSTDTHENNRHDVLPPEGGRC